MFPNLVSIITDQVWVPLANLDSLTYLTTFHLLYGYSKVKNQPGGNLQEIILELEKMNTLQDIRLLAHRHCIISDQLFANNPDLTYFYTNNCIIQENVPSILNCRKLKNLYINTNINTNTNTNTNADPYVLKLTNLDYVCIAAPRGIPQEERQINDEIFMAPIFATCQKWFELNMYTVHTEF